MRVIYNDLEIVIASFKFRSHEEFVSFQKKNFTKNSLNLILGWSCNI